MRRPASHDSRLLAAGVVASLALVAYLAVAFANTHASVGGGEDISVAPWTPYHAELVPVRHGKELRDVVRVNPTKAGSYGGLIPTLVPDPTSGRDFVVGLWLKGSPGGPVGVTIDKFSPAKTSVYLVDKSVPVTPRWRHFTFRFRVKGTWLGLGMYVHRETSAAKRTWFAVRSPTAAVRRR